MHPSEDLDDLFENAPCGYVSLTPDARILKVNRTFTDWLGSTGEALVGQPFHALLSFGGRIAYETHLAPLLRLKAHVDEIALDLLHVGGGKVPVIGNATEKRGPDGQHILTRMTFFRAVERRSYERELLAARAQAEATAASEHETAVLREQFIAVLGHDLRNPLAALAAGIGIVGKREVLTERGRMIVKEMAASVARASALVDNVLDFARGRLGDGLTLTLAPEQPLEPVIEQVVGEIRAVTPDRQILLRLSIDQPVDCDPNRVAQLASNLIANAVTHGAPELPIKVEAYAREERFVLSVANGGVAISPKARAQLFQPFFRGAARRSQQGLGLGLFIVDQIARAHHGVMDVTSDKDETCFTFSMPLRVMAEARS